MVIERAASGDPEVKRHEVGIRPPRGGRWFPSSVANLLERAKTGVTFNKRELLLLQLDPRLADHLAPALAVRLGVLAQTLRRA